MYRVWYSTESFADYIIDHTVLSRTEERIEKRKIYESDANNPRNFHAVPAHIKNILYLDAPDLIIEHNAEPILSIEVTEEAGTGHNAFQRFGRIAAAVENGVPAIYIYPKGKVVSRSGGASIRWDALNPLVFRVLKCVMDIYRIPALLFYFPSRYDEGQQPHGAAMQDKGLLLDEDQFRYAGCPRASAASMQQMFGVIDDIIEATRDDTRGALRKLLGRRPVMDASQRMVDEYAAMKGKRDADKMSPLSATRRIPTAYLLNYLHKYESKNYAIGELLHSRKETVIYQVDAKFRGDPYPGCLAAIDYLTCREGSTFEDRRYNLVMVWGSLSLDEKNETLHIESGKEGCSIDRFVQSVQSSTKNMLLARTYGELKEEEIPRYYMQVRYGSMYTKAKHIRMYSHFADAILFPDGSLWRDN